MNTAGDRSCSERLHKLHKQRGLFSEKVPSKLSWETEVESNSAYSTLRQLLETLGKGPRNVIMFIKKHHCKWKLKLHFTIYYFSHRSLETDTEKHLKDATRHFLFVIQAHWIFNREHLWFCLLQRPSSKLVTAGPKQECTVEYIHSVLSYICTLEPLFVLLT